MNYEKTGSFVSLIKYKKENPSMNYEKTGSDVTKMVPVNGVIHVAGIIKTPTQMIRINWEVDCSPGETVCHSGYVQYEIDCLVQAGCKILSLELYE